MNLLSAREKPRQTSIPDGALVRAALNGDAWAGEALFRRHADNVNGFAFRLLGRDNELDDVVQESFAAALANLHKLEDPQAFASWLFSIVVTTVRRTLRRRRLLDRLGLRKTVPLDPETLVAPTASAEVAAELRRILSVAEGLPTDMRLVFLLRHLEGLLLHEIAQLTGVSLRTVKRRMARAEARLGITTHAPAKGNLSSRRFEEDIE